VNILKRHHLRMKLKRFFVDKINDMTNQTYPLKGTLI